MRLPPAGPMVCLRRAAKQYDLVCEQGVSASSGAPKGSPVVTPASYVPISHDARYFFCSFVNLSIGTPMPWSLRRAISWSIFLGTG